MRLFEDGSETQKMNRLETKSYGPLVSVRYQPTGA